MLSHAGKHRELPGPSYKIPYKVGFATDLKDKPPSVLNPLKSYYSFIRLQAYYSGTVLKITGTVSQE